MAHEKCIYNKVIWENLSLSSMQFVQFLQLASVRYRELILYQLKFSWCKILHLRNVFLHLVIENGITIYFNDFNMVSANRRNSLIIFSDLIPVKPL